MTDQADELLTPEQRVDAALDRIADSRGELILVSEMAREMRAYARERLKQPMACGDLRLELHRHDVHHYDLHGFTCVCGEHRDGDIEDHRWDLIYRHVCAEGRRVAERVADALAAQSESWCIPVGDHEQDHPCGRCPFCQMAAEHRALDLTPLLSEPGTKPTAR